MWYRAPVPADYVTDNEVTFASKWRVSERKAVKFTVVESSLHQAFGFSARKVAPWPCNLASSPRRKARGALAISPTLPGAG